MVHRFHALKKLKDSAKHLGGTQKPGAGTKQLESGVGQKGVCVEYKQNGLRRHPAHVCASDGSCTSGTIGGRVRPRAADQRVKQAKLTLL